MDTLQLHDMLVDKKGLGYTACRLCRVLLRSLFVKASEGSVLLMIAVCSEGA